MTTVVILIVIISLLNVMFYRQNTYKKQKAVRILCKYQSNIKTTARSASICITNDLHWVLNSHKILVSKELYVVVVCIRYSFFIILIHCLGWLYRILKFAVATFQGFTRGTSGPLQKQTFRFTTLLKTLKLSIK